MSAMADQDDRAVDAQCDIKAALAATLEQSIPGLTHKYKLDADEIRRAIGWAATSIAIDYQTAGLRYFDEERRHDLHRHLNYLWIGAREAAESLDADNQ
jgi:hypothetical protein